ncbi:MAG: hypothetical protein HYZ14_12980 [Bacteroidetes bacterium]|nr:hypothetical protein [Bacteroidota bacterium]
MKKIIFSIALIGLLVCSCEKDTTLQSTTEKGQTAEVNNQFKTSSLDVPYASIRLENGILSFEDMESVRITLEALESQYLSHQEDFLTANIGLTGEQLTELENTVGFREYLPYETFESTLGFSSLRSSIQTLETAWLENNEVLNSEDDPDNHFVIEKPIRTILNTFCEMKIANQYYRFFNGGYVIILDGDILKLELLRRDLNEALTMQNVLIEGELNNDRVAGCNSMQFDSYDAYNSSLTRRIKAQISHQTWPWNRYVLANTTNYKKKNSGWDKIRTYTLSRAYGHISGVVYDPQGNKTADCDTQLEFNTPGGVYSDHDNVKEWSHKVFVETKTKTGWVKGYHYGYHSPAITYTSILNW